MDKHKAGFVNIIGAPNAGKSTLMNKLVGESLSVITSKAQTTRHRIMGIVNGEDFQVIYSDTPGILDPAYELHKSMMRFVSAALEDADVILLVEDLSRPVTLPEHYLEKLQNLEIPVLVLLNKVDLSDEASVKKNVEAWEKTLPKAKVGAVSALHGFNLENLFERIIDMLPESPAYFPKDELTDKPLRFFVSEIIREKILKFYQKEVPYSCEVVVNQYEEGKKLDRIQADIIVVRDSQKGILLGKGGAMIKKMGRAARFDIQDLVEKQVHLELNVKVDKDWRNKAGKLKKYGYPS